MRPPPLKRLPERLESPRLLLRVAMPGDGRLLNEAVTESVDELAPWLPWVHPVPTIAQSESFCRSAWLNYQQDEDLVLLLFLRDSGEFVGASGLHQIDWPLRHFEIGYWLRSSFTGLGLAGEAVRALSDYTLQHLQANRVWLAMDARNTRSAAVAERAGFLREGTLRNERLDVRGRLRDTTVYSRVPARRR